MIMIGYSDGNKAYNVFDLTRRRCYIRRDIIFDERCCSSDTIIIEKVAHDDRNLKGMILIRVMVLKRNLQEEIPEFPSLEILMY